MKIKKTRTLAAAITALSLLAGAAQAKEETISQTLSKLPKVEIPAFATKHVIQADKEIREKEAVGIVRIIAIQEERALVPTVAAICHALPEIAAPTAAAAAKAAPKLADEIALRASQAAPKFAPKIAAAVAKEVPEKAVDVTKAVQSGTEGGDLLIVSEVARAVPTAQPSLRPLTPNNEGFSLSAQSGPTITVTQGGLGSDGNNTERVPDNYKGVTNRTP